MQLWIIGKSILQVVGCLNVRILVCLRKSVYFRVTRKVLMKALGRLKERVLVC